MNRLRMMAAWLCGILCVTGLVFGLVFTYATRTLFDPTRFSERVADSLGHPEVAGVVADQITDQILEARRDLTAYRPMVRGAVEYVVSSKPFRALVRRAAKRAHATVISTTGQEISLTVSDMGVVLRNALAMYPELAEKVPDRAQVALGAMQDWPAGTTIMRVLHAEKRMKTRALVWLSVGLGMGVLGTFLSRRRDRYLLRVGLGITICAVIMAAVAKYGGHAAAHVTSSTTLSQLIRGMWPAFIGPLAIRMIIMAGIGLVLIAGVTSLFQKVDLPALARVLWRRLATQPQQAWWGIMRAFVLIVLGLLVTFNPLEAAQAFGVFVGGILFFVGLQEVFSILMRAMPKVQASIDAAADQHGSTWPRVALVGTLVVLLIGAGAFWLVRDDKAVAVASTTIDACNGHPELCDRRLNQVAFAATHNSMSAADIADWMFPQQEGGVAAQLQDGIRGFLIDIHYGTPVGDRVKTELQDEAASMKKYQEILGPEGVDAAMRVRNRLIGQEETGERDVYLCHGFCELGAEKFVLALEQMRKFLVENPNEVVIIIIQDEGVSPADVAACFAKSGLEDFVYKGATTPPWPTLREMITTDQRVLVLAENTAEGVPWYHWVWDVFQETPYRFLKPEEMSNKVGRGGTKGSLLLMNNWIETTPAPLPSNAAIVNSYDVLLKRARACKRERKMVPNLIAVDYYRTGDLVRVVNAVNGIKDPVTVPVP